MRTEYYYLGTSACETIANSFSVSITDSSSNVKSFDEKICISYREDRHWHNIFYTPEELASGLQHLALQKDRAYYITNQALYGKARRRTVNNLFSFHNIIIDIDAHEYLQKREIDQEFLELIDKLVFVMTKDTWNLKPNFIVKTSRGIQCWWNFEETSKVLQFVYTRAVNTLFRVVSDIIKDNCLDSVFTVDKASKKLLGLFRLPGSFNPNTYRFTEICHIHNTKYDFTEFNDIISTDFDLEWDKDRPKQKTKPKQKKKKISPITQAKKGYLPLMVKRTRLIECMIDKGMIHIGHREMALFLFYNSLKQLPYIENTPEEQTIQLNKRLEKPLKSTELQAIFRTRKTYKISNALFYEYLGITESIAKEIYMTKSNFSRDYERMLKKQQRNKEIVRRYQIGKQSILGISKTMGISRNTVKTVLREVGILEPQAIKKELL